MEIENSYNRKKVELEKYQRNIFGFSFKVAFWSFENLLTILLTMLFGLIVVGFTVSKIMEIEAQKLDVLRST